MPAPTALPGWNDFNDIVLAAIGRRVSQATQNNVDGAGVVDALKKCRDEMGGFPPDFQAQLMEDECDADYFRVLQILDLDVRNGCHEAIAALAATGHLRAVITTNFDRLIELALEAHGTPHETFFTEKHFETLANRPPGVVPIIKVHGSVQSPKSMVDTLRQRLKAQPPPNQPAVSAHYANPPVHTVGITNPNISAYARARRGRLCSR